VRLPLRASPDLAGAGGKDLPPPLTMMEPCPRGGVCLSDLPECGEGAAADRRL